MQEMLIRWCTDTGDNKDGVLYNDLVSLLDWKCQPNKELVLRLSQPSDTTPKTGTSV